MTATLHPWRRSARTAFAVVGGVASLLPYVLAEVHVDDTVIGGQIIAVSTAITRILALPRVERFLQDFFPWLAANPRDYEGNG